MKRTVVYEHDPADLGSIELALSRVHPTEADWVPAFRDTVGGRRVVWARFPEGVAGTLWIRDRDGVRFATPL